ncbi:hypothetical protein PUN28_014984 [Cardiocondyla obscurior]|uniref:Uncharacterized protein n=1 Tax=Cardiocondyla obscurior TaxID=286306 RepID=A0AAW2F1F7_9HYME
MLSSSPCRESRPLESAGFNGDWARNGLYVQRRPAIRLRGPRAVRGNEVACVINWDPESNRYAALSTYGRLPGRLVQRTPRDPRRGRAEEGIPTSTAAMNMYITCNECQMPGRLAFKSGS